ncbi:MAG: flavoredoxin [Planctomycetota bacterium]
MAERIPDDALVVRGGRNQPEDLRRGTRTHPSGVTGASVECAEGLSGVELAGAMPHGRVGVTTAGAIRAAGGNVVRTSGRSPHHATLVGLSPEAASRLLTPSVRNPAQNS